MIIDVQPDAIRISHVAEPDLQTLLLNERICRAAGVEPGAVIDYRTERIEELTLDELQRRLDQADHERTHPCQ